MEIFIKNQFIFYLIENVIMNVIILEKELTNWALFRMKSSYNKINEIVLEKELTNRALFRMKSFYNKLFIKIRYDLLNNFFMAKLFTIP